MKGNMEEIISGQYIWRTTAKEENKCDWHRETCEKNSEESIYLYAYLSSIV